MYESGNDVETLIREAVPGDAAAIADIGRRSFTWAFGHLYREAGLARYLADTYSVEKITRSLAKPSNVYLVAEAAGRILGFLKLKVNSPGSGSSAMDAGEGTPWQTQKLYVDPDLIQRGTGRQIMQVGEERMRSQGASSTWLMVYLGNDRAIRFYEALGFEDVGREFHDFEELRVEFILMRKRL